MKLLSLLTKLTSIVFLSYVLSANYFLWSGYGFESRCTPPTVNEAATPRDRCSVLQRICFYQGALVSFDPNHYASFNLSTNRYELRPPIPYLPIWLESWNIPGASNSDAIVGNQEAYQLTIRPASRLEASPALRRPSFSNCTLPVVLLADWPFNFCEFFSNGASTADLLFRQRGMLPGRNATLVLALPAGLALQPFHQALLGHLSSRPLVSLDRMAAEAEAGGTAHVAWSHEGVPPACFSKMVLCKLPGTHEASPIITAAAVVEHLQARSPLPADPLDFGASYGTTAGHDARGSRPQQLPPLSEDTTLRVVVDARHGGVRTFRNLHQLIDACGSVRWDVGPFRRVVCRPLVTYDTPQLSGVDRFRATVAAVRSAHVMVAVHGAGAANAYFLRTDGGGGAGGTKTALLEVRPCGFGAKYPWWVDVHLAVHLPRLGDQIHFHAYNIEDPEQCSPADWSRAVHSAGGAANTRAGEGHHLRDQHLTLRPDGFLAMLRHVAAMLRDPAAFEAARTGHRLHGYALPSGSPYTENAAEAAMAAAMAAADDPAREGGGFNGGGTVVLGPLGVANLSEHVANGAEFLLRPTGLAEGATG